MNGTIAIDDYKISVPEGNIHALVTINGDEDIRAVMDEVMSRSKSKYISFLLEKAAELEADSLYAGCMVDMRESGDKFQYGVGFYKSEEFLGHVPFEREFLGQTWYARCTEERPLMRFLQMPSVAAEPRFKRHDEYRYSSFVKGPQIEFCPKATIDVHCEAPFKIDFEPG